MAADINVDVFEKNDEVDFKDFLLKQFLNGYGEQDAIYDSKESPLPEAKIQS